jgi:NAD(P)H dehydrogenase (quinone)
MGDDDFRQMGPSRVMAEEQVDMGLGLFAACRAHEFSVVDPTLEGLLGRRPQTLREVVADVQATPAD